MHCKAGLGRTATMICCYAMKNYKIPAVAMIAWNRICRPGSVLGPQQHFLLEHERTLMAAPSIFGASAAEITKKMKVRLHPALAGTRSGRRRSPHKNVHPR